MPIEMRVLTARGLLRYQAQPVSTERLDCETGNVDTANLTRRVSSVQVMSLKCVSVLPATFCSRDARRAPVNLHQNCNMFTNFMESG
jgi:hypothetical protein